jgi:hypothetical protein
VLKEKNQWNQYSCNVSNYNLHPPGEGRFE